MICWEYIPGYERLYRVSSYGHVQSCHKKGSRAGERGPWWDMSRPLDKMGYELVYLWDKKLNKRVRCLVHQLVAKAFVERVDGKNCVNHKDGNKRNNSWRNLEWVTRAGNMRHAWRTGLCKPHKLTGDDVIGILTYEANDTKTAEKFGVSQVWVTRIRAGKAWKSIHRKAAELGIYIPSPEEQ